jgi:hypothetical protein
MKNEMKNERYSRPRIRATALALLAVPGLACLSAIAVYAGGMEETETTPRYAKKTYYRMN